MEILEKLMEHNILEMANIISTCIRWIMWRVVTTLALLVNGIEKSITKIYNINGFFDSPEVTMLIDKYKPLIWVILGISIAALGFKIMFNRKQNRDELPANILFSILMLVLLPTLMTKLDSITSIAVKDVASEYTSSANELIKNNIYDLYYLDANNYDLSKKNNINSAEILSVNESETIDLEEVNNKGVLGKKIEFDKNGNKKLEDLESGWFKIDEEYYRYGIDFLTIIVTLGAMGITLMCVGLKVARLIFELAFNKLLATFFAFADIGDGKKLKEIIKHIFSIFIVIFATAIMTKLYVIFSSWLGTSLGNAGLSANGIAKMIVLVGGSIAVIDGPNIIERIIGIDAGLKNGWSAVIAGYGLGKGAINGISTLSNGVKNLVKTTAVGVSMGAGAVNGIFDKNNINDSNKDTNDKNNDNNNNLNNSLEEDMKNSNNTENKSSNSDDNKSKNIKENDEIKNVNMNTIEEEMKANKNLNSNSFNDNKNTNSIEDEMNGINHSNNDNSVSDNDSNERISDTNNNIIYSNANSRELKDINKNNDRSNSGNIQEEMYRNQASVSKIDGDSMINPNNIDNLNNEMNKGDLNNLTSKDIIKSAVSLDNFNNKESLNDEITRNNSSNLNSREALKGESVNNNNAIKDDQVSLDNFNNKESLSGEMNRNNPNNLNSREALKDESINSSNSFRNASANLDNSNSRESLNSEINRNNPNNLNSKENFKNEGIINDGVNVDNSNSRESLNGEMKSNFSNLGSSNSFKDEGVNNSADIRNNESRSIKNDNGMRYKEGVENIQSKEVQGNLNLDDRTKNKNVVGKMENRTIGEYTRDKVKSSKFIDDLARSYNLGKNTGSKWNVKNKK
ncbi:pLS20_p028 family conjugation system transmembrane protein [uncultured Clostridium sp.]|uniref:pLS20_p028 family conjugation system transmembrane protein n=1 Tax=uncultured Clostridium sp. TaxID=59620 RepID=UPI0025DE599E|nr:hypothetical protein [uncultured Clostridium sp.]